MNFFTIGNKLLYSLYKPVFLYIFFLIISVESPFNSDV